jgi:hypothetical protein
MPHYRFVLNGAETEPARSEEFGLFNDEGALRFARRYGHNGSVEIWEANRLVGRVEPARILTPAE